MPECMATDKNNRPLQIAEDGLFVLVAYLAA